VFDPQLQRRAWRTATLRHELAGALAEDRLVLHYQPIVRLEDGQIVSFEALVRWDHPERGLLAPVEFVPLAEQSPLIHDLGARVLDMACTTAKRWRVELQRPVPVAVNLSPAQLARDGVVDALAERVRVCGASLTDISLELTETVLIESSAGSRVVHALADTGFKLVLDDFGAGFSSLSYLHRFPFSTIKLDRSFIAALGTEAPVKAIIEGVVGIASAIGSDVVAEGVERPDQRAALLEIGCQLAQGYLFSRPVTEEAAAALLSQGPITGGSTR
jgi:EAL domain-containing protein (putative c-di-GMP-specific phosphodiesterase class I)